jgi:hypothetical protein
MIELIVEGTTLADKSDIPQYIRAARSAPFKLLYPAS